MKKNGYLIISLTILFYSGILLSQSAPTISTFTASVSFEGFSPITFIYIELRDIQTNLSRTSFTFTPVPGCLGIGTTWYTANEYAVIYTTWTSSSSGRLLVYTDNKASDAVPKYTGSDNPAGLVCLEEPNSSPLSLCWRITDISTTTYKVGWYLDNNNNMKLYAIGLPQTYWCFLWMKDRNDGKWSTQDDIDYATIKRVDLSGFWIHHGEGDWSPSTSPDYFYLAANFKNAKLGKTYQTSTLRFELRFD